MFWIAVKSSMHSRWRDGQSRSLHSSLRLHSRSAAVTTSIIAKRKPESWSSFAFASSSFVSPVIFSRASSALGLFFCPVPQFCHPRYTVFKRLKEGTSGSHRLHKIKRPSMFHRRSLMFCCAKTDLWFGTAPVTVFLYFQQVFIPVIHDAPLKL